MVRGKSEDKGLKEGTFPLVFLFFSSSFFFFDIFFFFSFLKSFSFTARKKIF